LLIVPADASPVGAIPADVSLVFDAMPQPVRMRALELRDLVLRVAAQQGTTLEETLKWGEPAYLPGCAGTTVRIGADKVGAHVKLLVNCRTSLVQDWQQMLGARLAFEGSRAILVPVDRDLDEEALSICIAAALTYHRRKRTG
tara:strand:+ start:620 stop:1048 length:429 start_codon:yes stop_codon:yes gene_type:complete